MNKHTTRNTHSIDPQQDRAVRAFQLAAAWAKASYSDGIRRRRRPTAPEPSAPPRGQRLSWKLWLLLAVLAAQLVLL
ncbi:MAG: hypothetical protein ACYTGW_07985 [Planctomycetota bacterium]